MKRIYSTDGQHSAPAWFVRSALLLSLPFMIPWAYLSTLLTEMSYAFGFARVEARIAWGDFKRLWRSAR